MNKPELYHKTVNILVDAYFNDTLIHNNCHACAVGNIVAANRGFKYVPTCDEDLKVIWQQDTDGIWSDVFITIANGIQDVYPSLYKREAKKQIDATGYSYQDLAKIEYAFETAPKGESNDEWMFNGLMGVIDVLDQIHNNIDTTTTRATKERFVKI